MSFILNMAWREMRASWHRLLLFFLAIAIGVGSIVGLRSLTENLKRAVAREVRSFFGADVRAAVNQPWGADARATLERYSGSPLVTAHTEIIETQTMVRAEDGVEARPFFVQLRAVKEQFPLYGEVKLRGAERYRHAMLEERGVLLQPTLLEQMNLQVGERVRIGQIAFTIRGVLESLPGNGMQFGPIQRALIDYQDAEAAGLTGFGSRVSYGWLLKTPEGGDASLVKELAREFRSTRLSFLASFRYQQNFMTRSLENIESFLGLVGLAILVLGGIGIGSVMRVFVDQKLKTIAILKCLGGENRQVLGAYLAQVLALSAIGSLLGLLLGSLITHLAPRYAAGRLPVELEPGLAPAATLEGIAIGLLVTLVFAIPPLLEIRQVKPILVLRQTGDSRRRFDSLRLAAGLSGIAGLIALIVWQSRSFKQAAIFLGWLLGTTLILNLAGAALLGLLRRVRRVPSFALRQGISSLYRPGNQTRVIMFAVGLGALFITATYLQQAIVEREFHLELDQAAADIFMIDVQKDQRAGAEAALERLAGAKPLLIPIVQGRIVGLKRAAGNLADLPESELQRRLNWERRFSYRAYQLENEQITAGKFWEPGPGAEAEVSVEERYGRELQLGVGDRLTFDILGQRIEARVSSIRRVERAHTPVAALTRFNILFRPGALEEAPQTFIGAVKGPEPGAARAQLQREFVEQFPNVLLLDALDSLSELRKRIGEFSFAVSFVGGFVFLCGVLILAGSVAMTKYQRLYEAAILKTLGAEKRLIICITLVEYGVLGLLAGLIGSAAATGLTWMSSTYSFNVPWRFVPSVNLVGVAATLLLVVAVGVLSSWDVLVKKPLAILRAQ